MSDSSSNPRKRTRSLKGLAFDEMKNVKSRTKSPSVKHAKLDGKADKATELKRKTNLSQKIIFKENESDEIGQRKTDGMNQVNNNSNVIKGVTKGINKQTKVKKIKSKVIHQCFRNVWRKELANEKHLKAKVGELKNLKVNSVLQNEEQAKDISDGINLDIEGGPEDLDYVDNIMRI